MKCKENVKSYKKNKKKFETERAKQPVEYFDYVY